MFADADLISSYSRAQALKDGILVDISETARKAGVKYPTVVTRGVYEQCVAWGDDAEQRTHALQDESGRLRDLAYMFSRAAKRSDGDRFNFSLHVVPCDGTSHTAKLVTLKAICHPGDTPEPVITISFPDED